MSVPAWTGTARYDRSGRYRYELTRTWSEGDRLICWAMLNPSTATAEANDPTIRRCLGLSVGWGYDGMIAVNAFALRSTDPAALRRARDPVGPGNDRAIRRAAGRAGLVVAAWGRHGRLGGRDERVLALLDGAEVRALGVNADGSPRHPLYVPSDVELVAYGAEAIA